MFLAKQLKPWLADDQLVDAVLIEDAVPSTNASLKTAILAGGSLPQVLIANQQTAGVGRRGHTFASPKEGGLYLSYAFAPTIPLELITPAAGVALSWALSDQFGITTRIKWVNDVQKNGKKIAGILAENLPEAHAVVLGVGVDLFPVGDPDFLAVTQPVTTVLDRRPVQDPRPELAGRLLQRLSELFAQPELIMPLYRKRAAWLHRQVKLTNHTPELTGTITGFDDHGALLLHTSTGTVAITTGTIRLLANE